MNFKNKKFYLISSAVILASLIFLINATGVSAAGGGENQN